MKISSVSIISPAIENHSPVGPSKVLIGLVGAVGGFIFSILLCGSIELVKAVRSES